MDAKILNIVASVAGIGGIAILMFYMLFGEVIRKSAFPKMTRTDFRLILFLIWSLAVAGIVAYVYLASPRNQTLLYRGSVRDDATKLPISGATISILGRTDIAAQTTDNSGNFSFPLETVTGSFQGKIHISYSGYGVLDKPLSLTSSTTEDIFLSKEKPIDFDLSGEVRDESGAIEGVRITVKDSNSFSTKDGTFRLTVKGQTGERFELKADKIGYKHWQENGVEARSGITIILEKK